MKLITIFLGGLAGIIFCVIPAIFLIRILEDKKNKKIDKNQDFKK